MKIKMLFGAVGSANAQGSATKMYEKDEIIDCKEPWQETLAQQFMDAELAVSVKVVEPTETKKQRARTTTGHYKADDPLTPDVNEAWEAVPEKK